VKAGCKKTILAEVEIEDVVAEEIDT